MQRLSRMLQAFLLFASLQATAQNLVTNSDFHTNVTAWTAGPDMATPAWNALDVDASPSSGSLLATTVLSDATAGRFVYQCVAVTPGARYNLGGAIRLPSDQTRTPDASISVSWHSPAFPCGSGNAIGFDYGGTRGFSGGPDIWARYATPVQAPAEATVAEFHLQMNPRLGSGTAKALFDAVHLDPVPAIPEGDFDNDTRSDLHWRNTVSGANVLWRMNGTTIGSTEVLPTVADTNWAPVGSGAFFKAASAVSNPETVVWRNGTTGGNVLWHYNGSITTEVQTDVPDTGWKVVAVADLSGNIYEDVIWRHTGSGAMSMWEMFEGGMTQSRTLPTVSDLNWQVAAVDDFDGDVRDDILWRNSSTGGNVVWFMNGNVITASAVLPAVPDTNWNVAATGDLQGDGKADIVWRNAASGANSAWLMNGAVVAVGAALPTVADTGWQIVHDGDFQGDGKMDLFWRHSVSGANVVWLMNGTTLAVSAVFPSVADTNWIVVPPR